MANRCMLFAARAVPGAAGEKVPVLALGEFGWGIPTIYKLLVSVRPQPCRSVVFGHDGPLAIAGDREGGLTLLKTLRGNLSNTAPAAKSLDEAIAYLSKAHIDHPYFLLEPGEILELESGPLDKSLCALLTEVGSLRIDRLTALAGTSDDAQDWATGSWTSILYFQPEGSERPPVDPGETFLTTGVTHLLANRDVLPQCRSLKQVYLALDGDAASAARALTALNEIPGSIELTLSGEIEELPATISQLKNVTQLGLGALGLRSVPDSLSQLTALRGLYLQSNSLQSVPECLRQLPNLKDLSLRQNPLRKIPPWIGELKGLETLYLDECDLDTIPQTLWSLPHLKSLNLMANPRIGPLPDGMERLSALEDLNLYGCGLETLPGGLSNLPRLKKLFIGGNNLTTLPDGLYDMRLDSLSLAGNPLRQPKWLGLWPKRRFRAKKLHWS